MAHKNADPGSLVEPAVHAWAAEPLGARGFVVRLEECGDHRPLFGGGAIQVNHGHRGHSRARAQPPPCPPSAATPRAPQDGDAGRRLASAAPQHTHLQCLGVLGLHGRFGHPVGARGGGGRPGLHPCTPAWHTHGHIP